MGAKKKRGSYENDVILRQIKGKLVFNIFK
jgi:hypothetical protein